MRKPKLNTSFDKLPADQVSPRAHKAVTSFTSNEYFPTGPTMVNDLGRAVESYDVHVAEHAFLTPSLTEERDLLRQAVRVQMGLLAAECNRQQPGNLAALLSTSLDLAAEPKARQTPAAITNFVLLDGTQAGSISSRVGRPANTTLFLARFTIDPTLDEKHWEVCFGSSIEQLFAGLPSGAQLRVKIAALNGASNTSNALWTPVLVRRVQ
ncbi:hypothetical protein Q5H93_05330 [Hymenobacter sp. ASUV-10]|uniref:Uncharacterized protein n=1 Tax=Hymenobacter aranciens TaxID=3063996 RepID=A0ABT9B796_9BACT|nr:hypothetical protein [Hymenobacter sp. ASUV-10]MDO7874146.1 hypothetical protein [Hymenobacter sp. ASUV-10]